MGFLILGALSYLMIRLGFGELLLCLAALYAIALWA